MLNRKEREVLLLIVKDTSIQDIQTIIWKKYPNWKYSDIGVNNIVDKLEILGYITWNWNNYDGGIYAEITKLWEEYSRKTRWDRILEWINKQNPLRSFIFALWALIISIIALIQK